MKTVIQVVRSVVGKDVYVFNDRLTGGERSLKFYSLSEERIRDVAEALRTEGYKVKEVRTTGTKFSRPRLRLHVL